MVLIIDNYDSFTYNLVQYIGELSKQDFDIAKDIKVYRHDKITLSQIEELSVDSIIISPGPKRPEHAGISVELIRHFAGKVPILGVCLGHQCIGYAYGATIVHAKRLMHGKVSYIHHDGKAIYEGIENPFVATRYHSLAIDKDTLPPELIPTAWSEDGELMGVRHREYIVEGVQFHPESILTEVGKDILANFLRLCIK